MKVLLIQDIKGRGKRMDIINVKDGFARNFLIPKRLAVAADDKALARKSEFEGKLQSDISLYREFTDKIKKDMLNFIVKSGTKGEIYESINKDKVAEALTNKGYKDFEVILPKPLKRLGEYQVEVKFPQGIKGKVNIILQH